MEQLTAMEQLIEWIDSDCTPMDCVMKAKELLKVEKEQIIKAHGDKGWAKPMIGENGIPQKDGITFGMTTGEQYYNEVYRGQGSPDTITSLNIQKK